ncbi:MAG TPA: M48 family metallopeptidase [Acidobacteriaceae bacterium]|jgi:Zn-dependent protease with chaperone function|nr:M48 family metallopeptidase [Acidobacteriaceae bacterium]
MMQGGAWLLAAAQSLCPLPPNKLAEAIALSHWRTALYFAGTAWGVLALWLLVRSRTGRAIARAAERLSSRAWIQGFVVAPVWLLILTGIGLPLALLGHHVSLEYGLSIEAWGPWWMDWAKSTGLTIVVGTAIAAVLYALMRRSPRRWWLWFWGFTVPVELLLVFVAPLVIDPMFNHFEPLAKVNPALVERLEQVAAKGGLNIPPSRMFVMDASRRSTGANAYVTGLGASKRIVVWDTTLKIETPNEILFTYGHEQGHYVLHHVAWGLAFSALGLLLAYGVGFWILRWLVRRRGSAWEIDGVASWSSLGLVLLLATVLNFLSAPVANSISRQIEHHADVYGQEVIHGLVPDPQTTVLHSFCSDALVWLDDPSPNPFVEFWTYSHPSTEQRAEFAAHYDPWLPGREPRYFSKR